ncbi:phospholipid carrier-dependent glycosyltransferase [Synechocystis sp. CACIAM 05]|uniref:phospholipid carrier-dependent glycosyltransferase n=1 Tax=Synechocystis sp. CACIAM 05 TaxID=1933929 RepID=UPI00138E8667|nr:dolichyl-phosphate-mannose--protein mannosyltransferase [Synechocystis sp. CACIAM 05]QHU99088.1 dolichyl-phosphate-mannose--protein O-mannosyl transferase [Synechocystis sp. CACIAM 05]
MLNQFPKLRLTPFTTGIVAIFLFSLVIRFWNLGQFNQLVFDEVYYAKFASDYWLGNDFFPSHPPLSHYLIALAMGLGQVFPVNPEQVNDLTGAVRSTWSYRWLNALTGATIPLILGAIAYLLTQRRLVTLLTMGLVALDGLFLVESRYALNNIYLVFFGLLGQALVLWHLRQGKLWQLILGGISLACAGSVKWNGFAFLLGVYLLWAIAWVKPFFNQGWAKGERQANSLQPLDRDGENNQGFLSRWLIISPLQFALWLVLVPAITYSVIWIPHLLMNGEYASLEGFWRIQRETWQYHRRVGNSPDIHPYCSPWYSWLVMARPIAYFYQKSGQFGLINDVHAMANPILLWFSTGAMALLTGTVIWQKIRQFSSQTINAPLRGITLYIAVNYAVNLLPWLGISRCTFFYHYLPAYAFSILALALILETLLDSPRHSHNVIAWTVLTLVAIAFWYWLPVFLGLPLTPRGFALRMLFPSWI